MANELITVEQAIDLIGADGVHIYYDDGQECVEVEEIVSDSPAGIFQALLLEDGTEIVLALGEYIDVKYDVGNEDYEQ